MSYKRFLVVISIVGLLSSCEKDNHSTRIVYFPNGKVQKELHLLNDSILHGYARTFFNSGEVKEIHFYRNGQLEGLQRSFFRNGKLYTEIPYRAGKINGIYKSYFSNGKLQEEANWKDGQKFGNRYFYDRSGKLAYYYCYDFSSKLFYVIRYDPLTGKVLKTSGHLLSNEFQGADLNNNVTKKSGNVHLKLTVADPPNCDVKVRMGALELTKTGGVGAIKELTLSNNVVVFDCHLKKGTNTFVGMVDLLSKKGGFIKSETIYTQVKVQ